MTEQKPAIGRIVHYVSRGSADDVFKSECRAAIVTEVQPGFKTPRAVIDVERIGIAVIDPTGLFFHSLEAGGCRYSAQGDIVGTWHWPERV